MKQLLTRGQLGAACQGMSGGGAKRFGNGLWLSVLVAVVAVLSGSTWAAEDSALAVADLRCESAESPTGIDAEQPRLSWIVDRRGAALKRGQKQTAYRILVATSEERLSHDNGDAWDSGKIVSESSVAVRYSGTALRPETPYWWKVQIWNQDGEPTAWSQPDRFLTGKLRPEHWRGKWIGPELKRRNLAAASLDGRRPEEGKAFHRHGAIYLRKEFDLPKPVVRAVLSFSGLGHSEVAIDGRKAGDYVIGPGFTDYDHRTPYLTFDVSDRFATVGRKRLDVILADGWYGLERDPWVHQLEKRPYVDVPKLRLDLLFVYADGAEGSIDSDESWVWSDGEITRSWIAEEDVDLRKANEAARHWSGVVPVDAPRGRLLHQRGPSNRVVEEFEPPAVDFDAKTGTATYDLGREVQGWVRFRARGSTGATLRVTTIPSDPSYPRTNLVVLAGAGLKETYEPRFLYVAMRRVKVSGLVEPPAPGDMMICGVSSLRTPAGSFSCSDEFVTWLEQAVRRTAINYTTFLPNDPVREWKAWTQDIQSMFGSMVYLFRESETLYERWQHDLLDSQRADGNMANVAPGPVFDDYNSPWWGGCGVWLPWEWRLAYGDDTLLRESYPAMKSYLGFLDAQAVAGGGLQSWGLGDWLPVEETPIALINTPAHVHLARVVSQTAGLLGRADEGRHYAAIADRVRDQFNRRFLDPSTGIYGQRGWKPHMGNWQVPGGLDRLHEVWWDGDRPCSEAGQVLPLALGLAPEMARPAVEAALRREVRAHTGRLSTGFVSTPYLLDVLTDLDADGCWALATAREFPSWYSMTRGSGNDVMKETWAGGQALMPSLGGSIARWCYRGLGGIRPDPEGPGFRRIIIKPMIIRQLAWVKCHHDSPRGRIRSDWAWDGDQLRLDVTIPVSAMATVYMPVRDGGAVTESGKPAAEAEGVRFLRLESGAAIYEVSSGTYRFESSRMNTTR